MQLQMGLMRGDIDHRPNDKQHAAQQRTDGQPALTFRLPAGKAAEIAIGRVDRQADDTQRERDMESADRTDLHGIPLPLVVSISR